MQHLDQFISRLLDGLASRFGVTVLATIFALISASSILYVARSTDLLGEARKIIDGPSIRNGAITVSDLYRVTSIANRAAAEGALNDDLRSEFEVALDILYVRADTLQGIMEQNDVPEEGLRALSSLWNVIDLADAALGAGVDDTADFARDLDEAAADAHAHLIRYLEDKHNDQAAAFAGTAGSLGEMARRHSTFIALNLLVAVTALCLLRREVIARRLRSAAEGRVAHLAYHDSLTGLHNRAWFTDRLEELFDRSEGLRQIGQGRRWSLVYLDLDDFKQINDLHGHQAGDAVLCRVSEGVRRIAEEHGGCAARLAGDEFALLLPLSHHRALERFAAKLIPQATVPIEHSGSRILPRLSIGIASAAKLAETEVVSSASLSRAADFALYCAKEEPGRGKMRQFDDDMALRLSQRRARLDALEQAILNENLEVWLQPKIVLATGAHVGFEALVRWRHEGDLIMPMEFITLAEESGLIIEIDRFMLRAATRAVAEWNARHGKDVSVSINLSGRHISSPDLESHVAAAIEASGLRPEQLTLELTESVEVRDWSAVSKKLNRLRELGCRLSLDDFGTGYSSLGYLRQMPTDELKLDKSFVTDLETSAVAREIVASVVDIARTLDLGVVIEGIETLAQAQIAEELGCAVGQGYFFGRPAPAGRCLPPGIPDDQITNPSTKSLPRLCRQN